MEQKLESLRASVKELRAIRDNEKAKLEKEEAETRQVEAERDAIQLKNMQIRAGIHKKFEEIALIMNNNVATEQAITRAANAIQKELEKPDAYIKEQEEILNGWKLEVKKTLDKFKDDAFNREIEALQFEKFELEKQLKSRERVYAKLMEAKEMEQQQQQRIQQQHHEQTIEIQTKIHEAEMRLMTHRFNTELKPRSNVVDDDNEDN